MAINNAINNTAASLTITTDGLTVSAGTTTLSTLTWGIALLNATGEVTSSGTGTSGQVLKSNGAGAAPTWQADSGSGGMTWAVVTADVTPMVVGNGYITNKASTACELTLPATGTAGDLIEIAGMGSTGWSILQTNAAHQILFGDSVGTTTGATGHMDSSDDHDCVSLVCLSTYVWLVKSSVGNITLA